MLKDTYIFEELGVIELIKRVYSIFESSAGSVDGSVKLSHRIMNEMRGSQHIVLHELHLLCQVLVMVQLP